jgi:hypothetical protein
MHAKLAVDDSVRVVAHSRRADRMPEAERARAHEIDEVLLVLGLWTGDELVPVPSFGPRMVCTRCCIIGADARPNWKEQPPRETLTGVQWR